MSNSVGKLVRCFNYEHDQIKSCNIGIVISCNRDTAIVLVNGTTESFSLRDIMFIDEFSFKV